MHVQDYITGRETNEKKQRPTWTWVVSTKNHVARAVRILISFVCNHIDHIRMRFDIRKDQTKNNAMYIR